MVRIVGRSIKKHPDSHVQHKRMRYILLGIFGLTTCFVAVNYVRHRKPAPVTGRVRYIAYSNEQFKEIAKIELESVSSIFLGSHYF